LYPCGFALNPAPEVSHYTHEAWKKSCGFDGLTYHFQGIEVTRECAILEVRRAGVDARVYDVPFRKSDES
jgi:hypothetical protein